MFLPRHHPGDATLASGRCCLTAVAGVRPPGSQDVIRAACVQRCAARRDQRCTREVPLREVRDTAASRRRYVVLPVRRGTGPNATGCSPAHRRRSNAGASRATRRPRSLRRPRGTRPSGPPSDLLRRWHVQRPRAAQCQQHVARRASRPPGRRTACSCRRTSGGSVVQVATFRRTRAG